MGTPPGRLLASLFRKSLGLGGLTLTNTSISRLSAKNVRLMRPTLFNSIATREELQPAAAELWKFIEKDGINVKIHKEYALGDIVQAIQDIESRKTTGKLILKP